MPAKLIHASSGYRVRRSRPRWSVANAAAHPGLVGGAGADRFGTRFVW
jgi:hypothetical protein